MKLPCSPGLLSHLVVWTDSKVLKCIEHVNPPYNPGLLSLSNSSRFESFENHQHMEFIWNCLSSPGLLSLKVIRGSNRFETFKAHQTLVKQTNSAGLLVVWHILNTSKSCETTLVVQIRSKPSKHIKFMWKYLIVLVYKWFGQIWNFQKTSNSCEATL